MVYTINIIDGIVARAPKPIIPHIAPLLQYDRDVARPGQFGVKMQRKQAWFINRGTGEFLCGFLPRVTDYLTAKGIPWQIEGNMVEPVRAVREPVLKGLFLRLDQLTLIAKIAHAQRGVIKAPTGSGKTITALGALSMYPNHRVLILVHRKDILQQFIDRIEKHLPERHLSTQVVMEGRRPELMGNTVLALIQTFNGYPIKSVCALFDIVIVDECHHVWERKSQYGKFFLGCLAPMKIGFTATPWEMNGADREKALGMEGMVGPIIGELTVEDGQELGIIARPYITLKPVPFDATVGDLRAYRDIYAEGIVGNRARNAIITKEALARAMRGVNSLTIVREVRHGELLRDMATAMGLQTMFIHGGTPSEQRLRAKFVLENNKSPNVIATDIWREGVDLPRLSTIIIAAAGKSKIQTLQAVGRGMRTAPGKTTVEVIDFLDPYRYLARHAVGRITTYVEKKWL